MCIPLLFILLWLLWLRQQQITCFLMSLLTLSAIFSVNEAKNKQTKTKHHHQTLHCSLSAVIDDNINLLSAQQDHVSSACTRVSSLRKIKLQRLAVETEVKLNR